MFSFDVLSFYVLFFLWFCFSMFCRSMFCHRSGGSVEERPIQEQEVGGLKPTFAVLCP